MLYTFEELSRFLNLEAENEDIDRLCFLTAYDLIEKIIGYYIEEKNHIELHTVQDNKILINQVNIKEVNSIIDQNTKERIDNCIVDYDNKTILFLSCKHDGHVVFINYNAGFTKETLPAAIKQAIIEMFLIKKNNFLAKLNDEIKQIPEELPESVKTYLRPYTRKYL